MKACCANRTIRRRKFLWAIFRDAFHYIAVHLESIADNARDVDFAHALGLRPGARPVRDLAGRRLASRSPSWVKEDIDAGKALCKAPLPAWVLRRPVAKAGGVHAPDGLL